MRLELVLVMLSVITAPSPSATKARVFQQLLAAPASTSAVLDVIRRARQEGSQAPRILCGMTIVTPDAALRSRMPVVSPSADRTYTVRIQQPPVCFHGDADGR